MPELPEVEALARVPGRAAAGPRHRPRRARRLQRAEDVRPPLPALASGSRSSDVTPARQVPRHRRAGHPPGVPPGPRRLAGLDVTQLPDQRRPGPARARSPAGGARRRSRLRPHRGGHPAQAGGVRRHRPADGARRRSAGSGPAGRQPSTSSARRDLAAPARAQLKGVLRDQRVIAGIGNAYSDEILHAAKLSPFKPASNARPTRSGSRCSRRSKDRAARGHPSGPRGWPPKETQGREEGRHCGCTAAPGSRARSAATTIAEVSFADSSLQYCPTCQTGGKVLADRRMSKLLK